MNKLVKNILYQILNLLLTVGIVWWNIVMVLDTVNHQKYPWNEVTTSLIISAVILLVIWFIPFIKFLRNLAILILIVALGVWLAFINIYPQVTNNFNVFFNQHKNDGSKIKIESVKVFESKKHQFQSKKHTSSVMNNYVFKVRLKEV